MKARFLPSTAHDIVDAPPSKSVSHRALIAAALSESSRLHGYDTSSRVRGHNEHSQIHGLSECDDVLATMDALLALEDGGRLDAFNFSDSSASSEPVICNCRESASTMRFLIPLALLSDKETVFTGTRRLLSRGFEPYERICSEQGLAFKINKNSSVGKSNDSNTAIGDFISENSITVRGPLMPGNFTVRGDISSQFISGLLFALPLLDGDSNICIEGNSSTCLEESSNICFGELESAGYVELTIDVLKKFGIRIEKTPGGFFVPGNQRYKNADFIVEGDWSAAAYLIAMGLEVRGLDQNSLQPDKIYPELAKKLEQTSKTCGNDFSGKISYNKSLYDDEIIDLSNCPDLAPLLFAEAALNGGGRFTGTHRLKIKETDRTAAMAEELKKFGVICSIYENEVEITGKAAPPTKTLLGHGDHRIVMALSVLCARLGGEIEGIEAVRKSFPNFFEVIKAAGIDVEISL